MTESSSEFGGVAMSPRHSLGVWRLMASIAFKVLRASSDLLILSKRSPCRSFFEAFAESLVLGILSSESGVTAIMIATLTNQSKMSVRPPPIDIDKPGFDPMNTGGIAKYMGIDKVETKRGFLPLFTVNAT